MRRAAGISLIESALVLLLLGVLATVGVSSFRSVRDASSGALSAPLLAATVADASRSLTSGTAAGELVAVLLAKGLPAIPAGSDPGSGEVSVTVDDPLEPSLVLASAPGSGVDCLVVLSRTLDPSAALEWFAGDSQSGCAASTMLSSGLTLLQGGSRLSPVDLP